MNYPKYYDEVDSITLYDPLAQILGTFDDGLIQFKYMQVVKSAGHSCPTVAGAYLITLAGVNALYPQDEDENAEEILPVRGHIKVEFKEALTDGVAGVIGNVISQITGATDKSGFKGLNGNFARHGLMDYNSDIKSSARFTRIDNLGKKVKSVDVFYDASSVGGNPKMQPLMQKVMMNQASQEEAKEFGELWQERVKKILIDNKEDVIRVETV
jgi:formylmethanofuran dehydrogenase subunit E